ncbi:MAG TPA: hypothetical protein P5081_08845 [Phycisphaerae bacterium]|nr:hypothetical protein [Phycisphaerae bacterium]HRW52982.1 hypothetical protein [Phycisphaerae bacterium]
MKMQRTCFFLLAGALVPAGSRSAAFAQCSNPSWNGYCPETTPRQGEQRISAQQFKASHNSYNRPQSLDAQIDDYNCWMIELDLWYKDSDDSIRVAHTCPISSADRFGSRLSELMNANDLDKRVTFIFLQLKYDCTNDNCDCGLLETCHPWPSDQRGRVLETVLNNVPQNEIYTVPEFRDIDNRAWPSYQELVRRGKRFVFVLGGCETNTNLDDLLFEKTADTSNNTNLYSNYSIVNTSGGCPGGSAPDPANPTDRFVWRAYPGGACLTCELQGNGWWEALVDTGYTFIATNCVDAQHTFDDFPVIHSPAPFYVVPSGSYSHNWGTRAFPRVGSLGLYRATTEVSAMVDVLISPGVYDISNESGFQNSNNRIDRPMILRCNGSGAVTLN